MGRPGFAVRSVAILLGACLLASATGCASALDRATERRALVDPGMSMDQVRAKLGEPATVERPGAADESWCYQYQAERHTVLTILIVIFVIALAVAMVAAAAKGGGSPGSFGGLGGGAVPRSRNSACTSTREAASSPSRRSRA